MADKKTDQASSPPVSEPQPASKSLRCFAPGSPVMWGDVPCRIIAVTLREGVFVYQVGWCVEKERRMDSFSPCELTATAESKFWTVQQ